MSRKSQWLIIILTILILIGSSFSYANAEEQKQVILILINQLSFEDKGIYKEVHGFAILEESGKGAMNINSAGVRNAGNSYLSISGGSRGIGTSNIGLAFQADEYTDVTNKVKAKDLFSQQTGKSITNNESIILLDMNNLRENEQKFPFIIGGLGQTLKDHGMISKVYGNNDTLDKKIRYAPLITMDSDGFSRGRIGAETTVIDNSRPFGFKTNYSYLLEQFYKEKEASLLVYDLGDLYRIEQFKGSMSIDYELAVRKQIYYEMGLFIESIINDINDNQVLIVASPMVNNNAIQNNNLLAPIWVYTNENEANILTSGTTQRDGLVANIDIAPTILEFLNVEDIPSDMLGSSIKIKESVIDLDKDLKHISTINQLRPDVLYPYVMWQIVVIVFSFAGIFVRSNLKIKIAQLLLLGTLYMPIMFLLTAYWTPKNHYVYLLVLISSSIILGLFSYRIELSKNFLLVGLITFIVITLDILFDSFLMKRSFLGYDPIIGARYYGIGNEYMGIYIGSALLFTSALIQLRKNTTTILLTGLVYVLLVLMLILPGFGTNAGGAIAAIVATGYTFFYLVGLRWNKITFILLFFIILLGLFLLVAVNYLSPQESQSHIGRAILQIEDGNIEVIYQTILRKLSMNWQLIQVSSWSKVMITSILAIALLFATDSFRSLKVKYTNLFFGFYGIVLGSFVALLVNDSGVVAASTMIIYVAIPMLYIKLKEKELK